MLRSRLWLGLLALGFAALACNLTSAPPTAIPTMTPTPLVIFVTPTPTPGLGVPTLTPRPATQIPAPCVPQNLGFIYQVQSGDTVSSIAARTGSTVEVLVQANCLANPNSIVVGQVLRVPRAPTTPTPTQTALSIGGLVLQPGTATQNGYTVPQGNILITATSVVGAVEVTFFVLPAGTTNPVALARDSNLLDGASTTWQVSDPNLNVLLYGVATNALNQKVQTTPITVTAQQQFPAPSVGSISFVPFITDAARPGVTILPPGAIQVSASAILNASKVEFYYLAQTAGAQPTLIGSVDNPGTTASIAWLVGQGTTTPGTSGLVWAVVRNAAGQTATTASVPIFIRQ